MGKVRGKMAGEKTKEKKENAGPKVSEEATKEKKDRGKFPGNVFSVAKDTFGEFMTDNCLNLSAAVAYYALQSIIPLILGFIALGSFFLQDPAARQGFISGIESAIPPEVGAAIKFNDLIDGLIKGAGTAGVLSIVTLLWTGSGIFDQFIFAINMAFDVEKDERNFFVKLALRVLMLFVLGGLLALAFTITILFNVIFTAKVSLFGISPDNFSFILPVLSYLIPLLLEAAIFVILYRFSPARKGLEWKPIITAALIAAVLFEILKLGFAFYVSFFGAASSATKTYGAIGGIIVFLFFLYLSAAVILFGAEIAAVLHDFKSGMASVKTENAVVEVPGKNVGGTIMPEDSSKTPGGKASKSPQGKDFDYGTVENPASRGKSPAFGGAGSKPETSNPVAIVVGGVALLIAAALSALFRPKTPAA